MGKGSLVKSLKKFHPRLYRNLRRVVAYNSRPPRPGETDGVEFHFRPRAYIEELVQRKGLVALESRGDLHAVNMKKLNKIIARRDALLMDAPHMVAALLAHPQIPKVPTFTIIMSPLSREEILFYKEECVRSFSLEEFVTDLMRRKLLRRTRRQKNILSLRDLEEVEVRARSAYAELKQAHLFDYVFINHEGGDNEYWNSFYYPVGDPLRVLNCFVDLLEGRPPACAEKWEPGLVP
jgi:guanylate kinase